MNYTGMVGSAMSYLVKNTKQQVVAGTSIHKSRLDEKLEQEEIRINECERARNALKQIVEAAIYNLDSATFDIEVYRTKINKIKEEFPCLARMNETLCFTNLDFEYEKPTVILEWVVIHPLLIEVSDARFKFANGKMRCYYYKNGKVEVYSYVFDERRQRHVIVPDKEKVTFEQFDKNVTDLILLLNNR